MAGVVVPGRRDVGLLSTVMKGLSIARDVYGIQADMADIEQKNKLEQERIEQAGLAKKEKEFLARGGKTQGQLNDAVLKQEIRVVDAGTPGALRIPTQGDDGTSFDTFVIPAIKPPEPISASEQAKIDVANRGLDLKEKEIAQRGELARAKTGAAPGVGRGLPSTAATSIAEFDAAEKLVDELEKSWNSKIGTFSGITQNFSNSDATQYNDLREVVAQGVGPILEEGKLTDADYPRYMKMLPDPWDTQERAKERFGTMRKLIAEKKRAHIEGAGSAGYNVSGFNQAQGKSILDDGTATASPQQKQLDPKIKSYAQDHGLDYETAASILTSRGYKP